MELKHCRFCDKVFATPGPDVCSGCWGKLDEIYSLARTAIRDHRNERLDVTSLAEIIDVDEVYIQILVDQGRLELASKDDGRPRCRSCGAEVFPGQPYCDSCRQRLVQGFTSDGEHKKKTMFRQERREKRGG